MTAIVNFFKKFFMYLGQYFLNWLNLFDHMLNTLLLGDANETVSARTARARKAGQKWAIFVCNFLTTATRIVTFGAVNRDHCDYALDASVLPNSREIWNWSKMEINETPVTIILDTELPIANTLG